MVQRISTPTGRLKRSLSLFLATLLISVQFAACSSPDDPVATATRSAQSTATTTLAAPSSTSSPSLPETATATAEPSSDVAADPTETEATIGYDALASEVASLVDDTSGLVEVVITLADGTTVTDINSHEPMEAASLYKLAIMVELFIERELGNLTFDEEIVLDPGFFAEEDSVFGEGDIGVAVSIETLLDTMITLSSNVAATALLDRVGNENINLTMASLGLSSTEIRWAPVHGERPPVDDLADDEDVEEPGDESPPDSEPSEEPAIEEEPTEEPVEETEESGNLPGRRVLLDTRADEALNVTTAADIADLYLMLVNGLIISDAVSQEMLDLLQNQQINDRLPAYLPEGTTVAHKTGNLDGLVHDAGVVYAPAGPIIVVVLTEDLEEWQAIDLIATIARLAYDSGT